MSIEARAVKKFIQGSPRKMRLVADQIRGKNVEEAINLLHFAPQRAAKVCGLTLRSAISNLQNAKESGRLDPANVFVKAVMVDGGPAAKRVLPAPMGRAYRVRKRTNHLTIIVSENE